MMIRSSDREQRRRARRGGFSLLEVMIALSILAFGLLGMIAMQANAMRQGSKGHHTTAAAAIARDAYEILPRIPFSAPAMQVTAGWINPPWINVFGFLPGEVPTQTTDAGGVIHTEHIYTVWYRVLPDPGGNLDLRLVDLEVTWVEDGEAPVKPTRTGFPTVAFSGIVVDNDE